MYYCLVIELQKKRGYMWKEKTCCRSFKSCLLIGRPVLVLPRQIGNPKHDLGQLLLFGRARWLGALGRLRHGDKDGHAQLLCVGIRETRARGVGRCGRRGVLGRGRLSSSKEACEGVPRACGGGCCVRRRRRRLASWLGQHRGRHGHDFIPFFLGSRDPYLP